MSEIDAPPRSLRSRNCRFRPAQPRNRRISHRSSVKKRSLRDYRPGIFSGPTRGGRHSEFERGPAYVYQTVRPLVELDRADPRRGLRQRDRGARVGPDAVHRAGQRHRDGRPSTRGLRLREPAGPAQDDRRAAARDRDPRVGTAQRVLQRHEPPGRIPGRRGRELRVVPAAEHAGHEWPRGLPANAEHAGELRDAHRAALPG